MTPADLAKAIAAASPGALIELPPGSYGDLVLKKPLTLRGSRGAVFRSVSLTALASGSRLEGFSVALTPTATTTSASSAVKVTGASDVVLRDLAIRVGPAITGVPETWDPDVRRPGGAAEVIGWPTGRGITITGGEAVTVEGVEISDAFRGIVIDGAARVAILGCDLHDIRTSPIVGAPGDGLRIEGNRLRQSRPWGWGHGLGDHGDFIHLWTVAGRPPIRSLRILDNLIDQGDGEAILGIYLDDGTPALGLGFPDVVISGNTLLNGNHQGMRLENAHGLARGNALLQTAGGAKDAPIIVQAAGSDVLVEDNFVAAGVQPPEALAFARWAWARDRAATPPCAP